MSLDCDYPAPCSCGCHWGGEAVSKPTPAAALRAYMDGTGELPFKFHETCEALLAHVERLEAALVEYAVAWDDYQASMWPKNRRKSPFLVSYEDTCAKGDVANKAEDAVRALGREIAGRKP